MVASFDPVNIPSANTARETERDTRGEPDQTRLKTEDQFVIEHHSKTLN